MSRNDKKVVTDVVLVERFKAGSMEAFEELVSRYESKAYNMALRFTRNQEDAEEVLQDVFTTLFRKIEGFQGKSAFSSWMHRVIVNAAFMKLRKNKQNQTTALEDLAPAVRQSCIERDETLSGRSDSESMNREVREQLQTAIDKLPEDYRAVFVLRDVDGMSNQEVSEILGLSIPAVKSRLHRSRLMLRKRLQKFYDDYTGIRAGINMTPGYVEVA